MSPRGGGGGGGGGVRWVGVHGGGDGVLGVEVNNSQATPPHPPCHPPRLLDKPANFPITCGAIGYWKTGRLLNGKQGGRWGQRMLTIS